ncbi:hypothetical protein B484DRAFT_388993 [Ochromonadaceae sp. CCMP2298]|nr:hypothetical protein B484DRAFT_388993 [Ochromonadaceae sp. CCMP2298]
MSSTMHGYGYKKKHIAPRLFLNAGGASLNTNLSNMNASIGSSKKMSGLKTVIAAIGVSRRSLEMTPQQLVSFVHVLRRNGKPAPIYRGPCGTSFHYPDLVFAMPAKHSEFNQYLKVYIHVAHDYIDICKVPFDKTTTALMVFGGSSVAVGLLLASVYHQQKKWGYIK